MEGSGSDASASRVDSEQGTEPTDVRRLVKSVAHVAVGAVVLLAGVAALAHWLRPELESVGRYFVEHYGLLGMSVGTFIADGFHFPVPPQFYMLMGITANHPPAATLSAITIGSLLGGTAGFVLARRLGRTKRFARWLKGSAQLIEPLKKRHGYGVVLLLSLTPVAFSLLCYLAGAYGFSKRIFAVIAVMRIPKLVLYYYLVQLGWSIQ